MTFSGFNNMTFIRENPSPYQKINVTCFFETIPADILKIEIPINKNKRYVQQACISNLLVTVFAVSHRNRAKSLTSSDGANTAP